MNSFSATITTTFRKAHSNEVHFQYISFTIMCRLVELVSTSFQCQEFHLHFEDHIYIRVQQDAMIYILNVHTLYVASQTLSCTVSPRI